jgi:2-oxo-4-hydroxy-4-carboxy-5-ureidoimidazoline decarboxylase
MPKLADLNSLARDEFTRVVGPVFEHSPWIAERTWERSPFANVETLHTELSRTVQDASTEEKLALVRAHPELAGGSELTRASEKEQASAGLTNLVKSEATKLQERNRAYRERFGFPFVICVRKTQKEAMLAALEERLQNSPEAELEVALREISEIARLRLADLTND